MKDYFEVLGVNELTSKPLITIAYVYALKYGKEKRVDSSKLTDFHVAYHLLKSYRIRMSLKRKNNNQTIKDKERDLLEMAEKGQLSIDSLPSLYILEVKYLIRTLLMGFFTLIVSLLSNDISNFLGFTMSFRGFIASILFLTSLIGIMTNTIHFTYASGLILISFFLIAWFLKDFKRKIRKSIEN